MNVADMQARITLSDPRPSARAIIHAVAQKHELTTHDLTGKDRCRPMAWARHEAFDRIYKETHMSLPAIARIFGMDHTSVLYGIWAHRKRKEQGKVT